jgi:hypothetical protein
MAEPGKKCRMIPAVTDELLLNAVQTERMIESGRAYFLQGRVADLDIDHALNAVYARDAAARP